MVYLRRHHLRRSMAEWLARLVEELIDLFNFWDAL